MIPFWDSFGGGSHRTMSDLLEAASAVTLSGGSAGTSEWVRATTSAEKAPSPLALKAETQKVYSVYSRRSLRWCCRWFTVTDFTSESSDWKQEGPRLNFGPAPLGESLFYCLVAGEATREMKLLVGSQDGGPQTHITVPQSGESISELSQK